jgi:hypothetical protein
MPRSPTRQAGQRQRLFSRLREPGDTLPPTRPAIRGARPVGAALGKAAGKALRKHGFSEADLVLRWAEIVGERLAANSWPEKLTRGRDGQGGTLTLRVPGALALELQHRAPQIIARINGYFGRPVVARLALSQGPLPARAEAAKGEGDGALTDEENAALERSLAGFPDGPLRASLMRLGRQVYLRARRPV